MTFCWLRLYTRRLKYKLRPSIRRLDYKLRPSFRRLDVDASFYSTSLFQLPLKMTWFNIQRLDCSLLRWIEISNLNADETWLHHLTDDLDWMRRLIDDFWNCWLRDLTDDFVLFASFECLHSLDVGVTSDPVVIIWVIMCTTIARFARNYIVSEQWKCVSYANARALEIEEQKGIDMW